MNRFKVIQCCQGQLKEYKYKNLLSALIGYAYHYLKNKKHGTMSYILKEVFYDYTCF